MNKYQKSLNTLRKEYLNNDSKECDILQELVDKATPKKPTKIYKRCPNCDHKVSWNYYADRKLNYCPECGQRLDWSDEDVD
ncbi:hypothetical protein [Candidatus Stoquefichus sp. SB1]|uniref:hypothetical protein n=1 Tax=Candidatus Stoquefichus sp. SB1 TaxID=1658109 RepID=UPI00067E6D77|nr:hypothetical protein [Candidatus Stoquefichus sp. SB1]